MFHCSLECISRITLSILLFGSFLLFSPSLAKGWGKEGHQIVAAIAERYLQAHSPNALTRAKSLLQGQSLIDVATFADDVRNKRPYTKNWHFVDIAIDEDSYRAERDCKLTPKGDCSIQALLRFAAILTDKSEDPCVRAEALKFVVHLIGDMHQPLHNIDDNDAGGNGKTVRFFGLQGFNGGPPNLHEVWDEGIIIHSGKSMSQFVASLGAPDSNDVADIIAVTNPIAWVQEAHLLAQQAYEALPEPNADDVYVLDQDSTYFDKGIIVVNKQLRKAGLRLGRAIEKALG